MGFESPIKNCLLHMTANNDVTELFTHQSVPYRQSVVTMAVPGNW